MARKCSFKQVAPSGLSFHPPIPDVRCTLPPKPATTGFFPMGRVPFLVAERNDCSQVCGAATAFRPVAVGVGGAELGAPMSQGPTGESAGPQRRKAPLSGAAPRQDPLREQRVSRRTSGLLGDRTRLQPSVHGCASLQFFPIPISTFRGTTSSMTRSISSVTIGRTVSTSASGSSSISSSWT